MHAALLVVLAVLAIGAGALVLVTLRRPAATSAGPLPATPAQVWLSRAERAAARLTAEPCDRAGWAQVLTAAEALLAELRVCAQRVAGHHERLAELPRLTAERELLVARMNQFDERTEESGDTGDTRDTEHAAVLSACRAAERVLAARIEAGQRHRAAMNALVIRMHAASDGLHRVVEEVADAERPCDVLAERLRALHAGLTEVEDLATPARGPAQIRDDPDGVSGNP